MLPCAKLVGNGCDHMKEACFQFGGAAYFYIEHGLGREVSQEEALELIRQAQKEGLVLQPGNSQRPFAICCCCGCCCEVLKSAKRLDEPAQFFATNHVSEVDADTCAGCGTCVEECPMDALSLVDDVATVALDRCIGCGVCVVACPIEAIALKKTREDNELTPPKNTSEMYMKIFMEKLRLEEE